MPLATALRFGEPTLPSTTDPTTCPPSGLARPQAPRPSGRALGYKFDPIPRRAIDLVASRELQPIDVEVLALLLRYRSRLRTSCWTTIARLATGIGRSESTVHRSLRRLRAAGLIRHEQIADRGEPDPDEPRNRTGWRFYFAWMDPTPASPAVTPTPCQPRHPLPVSRDTQVEKERTPPQGANQDDEDAVVVIPSTPPPQEKTPEPTWDVAVEAAAALVGRPAGAVRQLRREMPEVTPEGVVEAVAVAVAKRKGWGYARGIVGNRIEEGRPIPPAPGPGGPVRGPGGLAQGPEARRLAREADRAEEALQEQHRAAWGALSPPEQAEIRAEVLREHPHPWLRRHPAWLEGLAMHRFIEARGDGS